MTVPHKGAGTQLYVGLALKLLGILTIMLLLTVSRFRSTVSPMPLIPLFVVAGMHWVSWRLYVHNN
jgi:hypothetical protein